MSKRQTRKVPGKAELARLCDDSEEIRKAQAAAPTWSDIQSAFPDAKIVDHPDGTRSCRIEDHAAGKPRLRLLNEMFKKKCHMDADIGQKRNARHREVVMRDPSGNKRYVREEFEERVAKKVGSRRVHTQRFAGHDSYKDAQGRTWVKRPTEREWRLLDG